MKGILIRCKFLPRSISAITLFPFILHREMILRKLELDQRLVNHENIHIQQCIELGVIGFYVLYILNWVVNLLIYRNSYKAYKNISFEREAYKNQSNLNYLNTRKRYNYI